MYISTRVVQTYGRTRISEFFWNHELHAPVGVCAKCFRKRRIKNAVNVNTWLLEWQLSTQFIALGRMTIGDFGVYAVACRQLRLDLGRRGGAFFQLDLVLKHETNAETVGTGGKAFYFWFLHFMSSIPRSQVQLHSSNKNLLTKNATQQPILSQGP
jgi:hypothetical protein